MPNGSDCCSLLQTEPLCVPTQWLVFDCTANGRCAQWFQKDQENTIDYVWARQGLDPPPADADSVSLKRAFVRMRPPAIAALLDTYHSRCEAGSRGRLVIWLIGDLGDSLGSLLLAELPLDLSNVIFWESGLAPGVIRAAIGRGRDERRRFLSMVRDQYFSMPDFSFCYYGQHERGHLYGNLFDSCLLAADDAPMRAVIQHLLPLHIEETRFARQHQQPKRAGGLLVIEEAMAGSRHWRRIDWLAISSYPYFPRLWDTEKDDILDVLDYRRCPERATDPWAALKKRSRESDWAHLDLDPQAYHLMQGEQPYRISPGDNRARRSLAQFLLNCGDSDAALEQCGIARKEAKTELDPLWLKIEGLARREPESALTPPQPAALVRLLTDVRLFYEGNRRAEVGVLLLTLFSAIFGLGWAGWVGALGAVLLGGTAYFLTPFLAGRFHRWSRRRAQDFTSRTEIREIANLGRVLEIALAGSDSSVVAARGGAIVEKEVAEQQPRYLVINLLGFNARFGNLNDVVRVLVAGAVSMRKLGPDRQTRILAAGPTAAELDKLLRLVGAESVFGEGIHSNLESALEQTTKIRDDPTV